VPASRPDVSSTEVPQAAACEYEPWDGPAALVFSDGRLLGAKLDRNGLRPMRYVRTCTGWLIAGSETGLADFHEKEIIERGRLGPGAALLVDLESSSVFPPSAVPPTASTSKQSRKLARLVRSQPAADLERQIVAEPRRLAAASGWSEDQIGFLLHPLAEGKEPLYSMGDDTPPAFLSKMRRTLWDYCKQRFAQVTNPPIDPLREAHVMSLDTRIGSSFVAESPVIDQCQMEMLKQRLPGFHCVDATFHSALGVAGALESIELIRRQVRWSPGAAPSMVVITDREVSDQRAPLPILLAAAAVWKETVLGGHFRIPLIVETAQVIETHHVALLLAVGATAVLPYLALQLAQEHTSGGARNYYNAVNAGLKRVLSRMGISVLASYRNAQLFEIIGLDEDVCRDFFESAPHWAEARSLEQILGDYLANHEQAFRSEFKAPADACGIETVRAPSRRRRPEICARCGHCRVARRRRVRVRDGRAAGDGLRHGAPVPPQYLSCWNCHSG
jgi:glutamate synthase (ferredoxin)